MSSRSHDLIVARATFLAGAAAVVVVLVLAGCKREERRFQEIPAAGGNGTRGVHPENPYEQSAWSVAEGKRLYAWFNCVECHAWGGGHIGPPLMDATWIYGSEPDAVFSSIADGRPNGMPSYKDKVPENEIWQLVAYVRSMSGLVPMNERPGRNDTLGVKAPESQQSPEQPIPEKGPHP